jgi:[ribosomal protein S18]-alanine N-acetyltransferase
MYIVRAMNTRDLNGVMTVNELCFSTPWSYHSVKYDLQQNPFSYWVVLEWIQPTEIKSNLNRLLRWLGQSRAERRILGFAAFWLMSGEAHITNIGIDPASRGMGWGEVLLTSILRRSISLGAQFSSLEVRVSNQTAINLYEKYGYRRVGYRQGYYHDNLEDAHEMSTSHFDLCYEQMLNEYQSLLVARLRWRDYFTGSNHYEARRTSASTR